MRGTSLRPVGTLMLALALITARPAFAQLGALVSPGRLSKAHASLEGITGCLSCHAAGQGVSAAKCLTCHKPIAERIAQKRGVHRAVTADCVKCHVEHAGLDGELRPFDLARFNHATDTRFPLDGLHAPLAATCAACHKTRSYLAVTASCASCHADAHKGSLGTQCATCHSTSLKFADTRKGFDHSRTQFPLTGSHAGVACTACHKNNTFKGVSFATCASCHADPHQQSFGTSCASCHTTQGWRSARVDHSRTSFPLKGLHATVACAKCHVKPATQVKLQVAGCATCHSDPHKGTFKQDCAACHTEAGFKKGSFDHSTTRFPLVDKHAGLACAACHNDSSPPAAAVAARGVVPLSGRGRPASARGLPSAASVPRDFRGLQTACASCHADVHQGELGSACESCHTARTFEVSPFTHGRQRPFFAGLHAPLRCVQCHRPATGPAGAATIAGKIAPKTPPRMAHLGLARTPDSCASCHADVHAGQLGACERCHTLDAPKFAVASFSHEKTRFPLTGKHAPVACATCHPVETAAYPAGTVTARHFAGVGTQCASCHRDPHAGQLTQGCQTCHSAETFVVSRYSHQRTRTLGSFFTGRHLTPRCSQCHKPLARAAVPAPAATMAKMGRASALVDYRVTTTCTSCHTDVHRGGLGPRCESCHKP